MTRARSTGTSRPRYRRSRYAPSRRVCAFCAGKIESVNYKETDKLRGFITDRGKITPRRRTGTCARHQRIVATAIKRARHVALLPYVPAHMRLMSSAAFVE